MSRNIDAGLRAAWAEWSREPPNAPAMSKFGGWERAIYRHAYKAALEEAARECITVMRDSSDADKHERCADAIRALAEGLD